MCTRQRSKPWCPAHLPSAPWQVYDEADVGAEATKRIRSLQREFNKLLIQVRLPETAFVVCRLVCASVAWLPVVADRLGHTRQRFAGNCSAGRCCWASTSLSLLVPALHLTVLTLCDAGAGETRGGGAGGPGP